MTGYREIHRTAPPHDIIPLSGRRGLLAGLAGGLEQLRQICRSCSAGIIVLRRHHPRLGGLGNGLLEVACFNEVAPNSRGWCELMGLFRRAAVAKRERAINANPLGSNQYRKVDLEADVSGKTTSKQYTRAAVAKRERAVKGGITGGVGRPKNSLSDNVTDKLSDQKQYTRAAVAKRERANIPARDTHTGKFAPKPLEDTSATNGEPKDRTSAAVV